jgi:hypothetical protein
MKSPPSEWRAKLNLLLIRLIISVLWQYHTPPIAGWQ